jgi:uncharacterized protein (TIGR02300 family)
MLLTAPQTRGKRQPIIAINSRRGRAVSKVEWGVKRLCQSCGTKFYDLQRAPITCPSCGTEADRESPLKSRRARSTAAAPKPVPVAPVKKPPPVEADAGGDAGGDASGDSGGDASGDAGGDASGDEVEDSDLGEDTADDSDDDLVEDTSELGDDDLSDVVVSKDDDDQR